MRKGLALLLTLSILSVAGCSKTYKGQVLEKAKAAGYDEDQQLASYHYSFRLLFGKKSDDGKAFELDTARLTKDQVLDQLERDLADVKSLLERKNEENTQYVNTFKLRPYFEHMEEVIRAQRDRVRVSALDDEFQAEMGFRPVWQDRDGPATGSYDSSVFKLDTLKEKYPFTNKVIEEAKANHLLEPVETYTVQRWRQYDRKEPDPSAPKDPNRFVWHSKQFGLEITKYKVVVKDEKPSNNFSDYLEAFRVKEDGKKESEPAIRAFLNGRGSTAVAVIDEDQEGKSGYGLPDAVESLSERSLFSDAMFARLFPNDESYKRIEAPKSLIRIEIAKVGSDVEDWEKAPSADGWKVPFSYQLGPTNTNYNVRLHFKKRKRGDQAPGRLIECVEKEWTNGERHRPSAGQVVECYKPKTPFDGPVLQAAVLHNEDTKRVNVVMPDGTEKAGLVTPMDNWFTGTKPFSVAYTLGEKRWLLKDEDGDGKFEKRKQVSMPEDKTGAYASGYAREDNDDYDPESTSRGGHRLDHK